MMAVTGEGAAMEGMAEVPSWIGYVTALAPAGAFVVALLAVVVAWRAHVLQKRAQRHQNLWESLTWAVGQLTDSQDDYRTQLGLSVLATLGEDPLINTTDNRLLRRVNLIVATRRTRRGEVAGGVTAKDRPSPAERENREDAGGTIVSKATGHELSYRTEDQRRTLERSNDLQEVIDRNTARLNRTRKPRR